MAFLVFVSRTDADIRPSHGAAERGFCLRPGDVGAQRLQVRSVLDSGDQRVEVPPRSDSQAATRGHHRSRSARLPQSSHLPRPRLWSASEAQQSLQQARRFDAFRLRGEPRRACPRHGRFRDIDVEHGDIARRVTPLRDRQHLARHPLGVLQQRQPLLRMQQPQERDRHIPQRQPHRLGGRRVLATNARLGPRDPCRALATGFEHLRDADVDIRERAGIRRTRTGADVDRRILAMTNPRTRQASSRFFNARSRDEHIRRLGACVRQSLVQGQGQ
jgi:hypothetical protein